MEDEKLGLWSRTGKGAKGAVIFVAAAVVTAAVGATVAIMVEERKPAFRVSVEKDPDLISISTGHVGDAATYLVFNKTIGEIGPPPARVDSCSDRYRWAKDNYQAVDADSTSFRVTLEGRKDEQVQVSDIEVKLLDSKTAPREEAVHLACPGQGAQPNITTVGVDLDQPAPTASATNRSGEAIPLLFTVKKGESEIFDVNAFTARCDCEWEITFVLRQGKKVHRSASDRSVRPPR